MTMVDLEQRRSVATRVAQLAGQRALALRDAGAPLTVGHKRARDVVSEADRAVESLIRTELRAAFPGDLVMGEELGGDPDGAFWCVDPIDGTANYLRGSPLWGTSIGYLVDDEPRLGVISLPTLDLLLVASAGGGVSCNGRALPERSASQIAIASIGEGPYWEAAGIGALERHLRDAGWGVAEYRCATVGLCFAALGYTDGYLERRTSLWDVAAGAVISAEAGLEVRLGGPRTTGGMWVQAGTPALLKVVDEVWEP